MAHILSLANQKGGVGKTTTAVNLAAALAESGQRTLLIDLDPQANATSSLGFDKRALTASVYDALLDGVPLAQVIRSTSWARLELAPSSPALSGADVELVNEDNRAQRLAAALEPLRAPYDYILVDCPPSLSLLTLNALAAADGVLIPVQCEYLALEGLSQLVATIERVRASLNPSLRVDGLIMTMFDARTHLSQQVADEVRRHFGAQTFATMIPRSVRLSEAPSFGKPGIVYAPSSPAAQAYRSLAAELLARLERPAASFDARDRRFAPARPQVAAAEPATVQPAASPLPDAIAMVSEAAADDQDVTHGAQGSSVPEHA